jgi:hypothetical protein
MRLNMNYRWNVGISNQQSAVNNQKRQNSFVRFWKRITRYALLTTLFLAACGTETPTPVAMLPSVMPKLLATVFISPTPNQSQQEATREASTAIPTAPPVAPSQQPTAYIGVFLGEAQPDDGGPVIDPALLDNAAVTPTSSFDSVRCTIQPDVKLGTAWTADGAALVGLGCPLEFMASYDGSLQIFERGVMYSRPTGEIWAFAPGDERYWYVPIAPPPSPEIIPPPDGLRQASELFRAVWQSVPGVRDAIGFAQTDQQQGLLLSQRFEGGSILLDSSSGQAFVLFADSTLGGPY